MSSLLFDLHGFLNVKNFITLQISLMEPQNDSKLPDIKEAYKNLQLTLGEESFKQYAALLRVYFSSRISKLKFDEDARKLLTSPEHIHLHNVFLLSLSSKINRSPAEEYEATARNIKYCSQELCLPNEDLIRDRVVVTSFDHGLERAKDEVTDLIIAAVQIFVKNILTAMISRNKGYKIRENNFQHAIGIPAPNPWLRNTNNIIDSMQETNLTINEEDQCLEPSVRPNLEVAEQQAAFSYACGSQNNSELKILTLRCLYETLLEDSSIINEHSIYSVNLERILSQLDCS